MRWLHPYDQWLESRSHAYVALRFAIRSWRDPGDVGIYGLPIALVSDRLTGDILDSTVQAFALMADEAARAHAAFMVTVVPVPVQVLDASGEKLRRTFPALATTIDMDLVQKAFVPRLAACAGDRGRGGPAARPARAGDAGLLGGARPAPVAARARGVVCRAQAGGSGRARPARGSAARVTVTGAAGTTSVRSRRASGRSRCQCTA